MSHDGQYVGRGFVGGNPLVPAPNPLTAVANAVGVFPDFHVQGNDARDVVSQTDLVQVGTAAENVATDRLIEAVPPLPMVTGVLNFPAPNDAWQAWDNTVNDIGTESEIIIITWKARTIPATRSLNAKFQNGVAGYETKLSSDGKAQFAAQVLGQVTQTVEIVGPFLVDIWHTTVSMVDSVNNRIGIGCVDEAPVEPGREAWKTIVDGTLSNSATWAMGLQRLQGFDGEILHTTHIRGSKADAILASGKGPKLIARDVAQLMWWDDARGRIT